MPLLIVTPYPNLPQAAGGSVVITGSTIENETLTADTSSITDPNGLGTFSYQWYSDAIPINGEASVTLLLTEPLSSTNVRVDVTYVDGVGTVEVLSSTSVFITNVNDVPTGSPVFTGTLDVDSILTANTSTIADEDGLGPFSYQWKSDGIDTVGATNSTYTVLVADVGKNISLLVSYTDGQGTNESLLSNSQGPVINSNDAPTGSVTISGTALVGSVITSDTSTIADADGVGAFSYQWKRDGINIVGANSSSYLLANADTNTSLTLDVTYTDDAGYNELLTSNTISSIGNPNDAPTGSPVIVGTTNVGNILSVDVSSIADADGLGTFSYQWNRGVQAILGATNNTYLLVNADQNTSITVTVSYVDGAGYSESLTSAPTGLIFNPNDAPTGSIVISGTTTVGSTLTHVEDIADVDGLGTFSYQWNRNGINITNATSTTYLLANEDTGTSITLVISYVDGAGYNESVTSNTISGITNPNDAPVGLPIITGVNDFNEVLTADASGITDADGIIPGSFSYQWQADGVDIIGETATTFTTTTTQIGQTITVYVTYTDGAGYNELVTSDPFGPLPSIVITTPAVLSTGTSVNDNTVILSRGVTANSTAFDVYKNSLSGWGLDHTYTFGVGNTNAPYLSADDNFFTIVDDQLPFENVGTVHVELWNGTAYTNVQDISGSTYGNGTKAYFGNETGLSDDGSILAIGADDNEYAGFINFSRLGRGFIFTKNGTNTFDYNSTFTSGSSLEYAFGQSVAVSGDGSTVAFGGQYVTSVAATSTNYYGRVYIFTIVNGTWTLQQKLFDDDRTLFGSKSIGLSFTGDTIVIGCSNAGGAGLHNRTYVYERAGGIWSQNSLLDKFPNTDPADFGKYVDITADGNTIFIAAPNAPVVALGAGFHGAIFKYIRSGGVFIEDVAGVVEADVADMRLGANGMEVSPTGNTIVAYSSSGGSKIYSI